MGEAYQNGEIFPAWARDTLDYLDSFKVDLESGLRSEDVEQRREIYGWNELQKHEGPSIFRLILEQFNDTLVRILLAAAEDTDIQGKKCMVFLGTTVVKCDRD